MKNNTIIIRDTDYSFLQTITKENGSELSRKLEKGSTEYLNACMSFHMKNTPIVIGNKI